MFSVLLIVIAAAPAVLGSDPFIEADSNQNILFSSNDAILKGNEGDISLNTLPSRFQSAHTSAEIFLEQELSQQSQQLSAQASGFRSAQTESLNAEGNQYYNEVSTAKSTLLQKLTTSTDNTNTLSRQVSTGKATADAELELGMSEKEGVINNAKSNAQSNIITYSIAATQEVDSETSQVSEMMSAYRSSLDTMVNEVDIANASISSLVVNTASNIQAQLDTFYRDEDGVVTLDLDVENGTTLGEIFENLEARVDSKVNAFISGTLDTLLQPVKSALSSALADHNAQLEDVFSLAENARSDVGADISESTSALKSSITADYQQAGTNLSSYTIQFENNVTSWKQNTFNQEKNSRQSNVDDCRISHLQKYQNDFDALLAGHAFNLSLANLSSTDDVIYQTWNESLHAVIAQETNSELTLISQIDARMSSKEVELEQANASYMQNINSLESSSISAKVQAFTNAENDLQLSKTAIFSEISEIKETQTFPGAPSLIDTAELPQPSDSFRLFDIISSGEAIHDVFGSLDDVSQTIAQTYNPCGGEMRFVPTAAVGGLIIASYSTTSQDILILRRDPTAVHEYPFVPYRTKLVTSIEYRQIFKIESAQLAEIWLGGSIHNSSWVPQITALQAGDILCGTEGDIEAVVTGLHTAASMLELTPERFRGTKFVMSTRDTRSNKFIGLSVQSVSDDPVDVRFFVHTQLYRSVTLNKFEVHIFETPKINTESVAGDWPDGSTPTRLNMNEPFAILSSGDVVVTMLGNYVSAGKAGPNLLLGTFRHDSMSVTPADLEPKYGGITDFANGNVIEQDLQGNPIQSSVDLMVNCMGKSGTSTATHNGHAELSDVLDSQILNWNGPPCIVRGSVPFSVTQHRTLSGDDGNDGVTWVRRSDMRRKFIILSSGDDTRNFVTQVVLVCAGPGSAKYTTQPFTQDAEMIRGSLDINCDEMLATDPPCQVAIDLQLAWLKREQSSETEDRKLTGVGALIETDVDCTVVLEAGTSKSDTSIFGGR